MNEPDLVRNQYHIKTNIIDINIQLNYINAKKWIAICPLRKILKKNYPKMN